jgi:hypothetical protein
LNFLRQFTYEVRWVGAHESIEVLTNAVCRDDGKSF